MAENNNFQQLVYYYQALEAQFNELNERLNYLEKAEMGLMITQQTIEEIRKAKKDEEIVLPIGNAAYIKAKVSETDKFLVSIDKSVLVERNADQALQLAKDNLEKNNNIKKVITDRLSQVTAEMERLAPQINQFVGARQGQNNNE